MWNLTTDPLGHVTNNKQMTPDIQAVLPFSVATGNEELTHNIQTFDQEIYNKAIDAFAEEIKLIFDGKASERVADFLLRILA
jgi:CDP-glycerol glycerophosphotransferase